MKVRFTSYDMEFVLLCDQIRQENNGKLIAIGIYGGDILVTEFPSVIPVALLVRLKTKSEGPYRIEVRYLLDGALIAGFESQMTVSPGSEVMGSLPEFPLHIPHAGKMVVQARDVPGADWQALASIPIKRIFPV